jgi:hypothetical protein
MTTRTIAVTTLIKVTDDENEVGAQALEGVAKAFRAGARRGQHGGIAWVALYPDGPAPDPGKTGHAAA